MNARPKYFSFDSLINLVSGLGTSKDKSTSTSYAFIELGQSQLEAAYRMDWVARKVVDIPAKDATREWRSWQAEGDQITEIEKLERELDVKRKVRDAMILGRLYGGGAIVLGTDAPKPEEPLDVETLGEGGLQYLHVLNRWEIRAGEIDNNVLSTTYSQPIWYEVNSTQLGMVKIHPSRIIRFLGSSVPSLALRADGWSDSVLQSLDDAIKNVGVTSSAAASLVWESKIDVVRIPNFMDNIGTADYKSRLIERFSLANQAKSFTNTLMLDKEEEWERINVQFGGLPEILKMYLLIASGAADIPVTRLLGQSPAGLNATGESDIRNYYDRISSEQETDLGPTLEDLDEAIIRSALGDRPEEIFYDWRPLWQMSEAEKADIADKKSKAFKTDVDSGILLEDALRVGRQNQLIEDGFYPGFEQAIQDAEEAQNQLDENDPQVLEQELKRVQMQRQIEVLNDPNTEIVAPGQAPKPKPEQFPPKDGV